MFAIFRLLNFIISTLFYGSSGSVHPAAPMLGIFLVIHRSWSLINNRSKGNCNFCRKVLVFVIVGCALNLWMTWFVWCDFLFAQLRLKTERVRRKMLRSLQAFVMPEKFYYFCSLFQEHLLWRTSDLHTAASEMALGSDCLGLSFWTLAFKTIWLSNITKISVAFKPVL